MKSKPKDYLFTTLIKGSELYDEPSLAGMIKEGLLYCHRSFLVVQSPEAIVEEIALRLYNDYGGADWIRAANVFRITLYRPGDHTRKSLEQGQNECLGEYTVSADLTPRFSAHSNRETEDDHVLLDGLAKAILALPMYAWEWVDSATAIDGILRSDYYQTYIRGHLIKLPFYALDDNLIIEVDGFVVATYDCESQKEGTNTDRFEKNRAQLQQYILELRDAGYAKHRIAVRKILADLIPTTTEEEETSE
jgi:hypothetical protein